MFSCDLCTRYLKLKQICITVEEYEIKKTIRRISLLQLGSVVKRGNDRRREILR